ncbi:MAG: FprA family A-type flavoprotein [Parasporobacterium sp.]|nr:FprA family A-type flavoprotein [Parasporobacterium sp.]
MKVTEDILYVGVNDHETDLFEGQYKIPNGISYNAYVIMDEKIALMDTVDKKKCDEYLANLDAALAGKTPDYLIVQHVEPDHASSIKAVVDKYPNICIAASAQALKVLPLYFELDLSGAITLKEGSELCLGSHTLTFVSAPMVHWPEVMMTYDMKDKVLFSADGFGKFGALDVEEDWDDEGRRYYFNIVGKFGQQVQAVLKKAAGLEISTICPLHGPVLTDMIPHVLEKYNIWSSYGAESEGVMVAYVTMHGNTGNAARKIAAILEEKGCPHVELTDLARTDSSEALSQAFNYGKVILASPSYNTGVNPIMSDFLHHICIKNYQNRTIGIIENGSWAPSAARTMKGIMAELKDITYIDPVVTIRGALKESDTEALNALADSMLK